jgi:hypothetical protein
MTKLELQVTMAGRAGADQIDHSSHSTANFRQTYTPHQTAQAIDGDGATKRKQEPIEARM